MKLIDDWTKSWKLWSVRLSAIGASAMGLFLYFPEWTLYLFNAMPKEVRDLLPDNLALFLAMVVFLGTALSRIVKQEKLAKREIHDLTYRQKELHTKVGEDKAFTLDGARKEFGDKK